MRMRVKNNSLNPCNIFTLYRTKVAQYGNDLRFRKCRKICQYSTCMSRMVCPWSEFLRKGLRLFMVYAYTHNNTSTSKKHVAKKEYKFSGTEVP